VSSGDLMVVVIVMIIAGSIFGPNIIRELTTLLGRNAPATAQRDQETTQDLHNLHEQIAELRSAHTDKILS
jgi:predicted PurR-regulated permease PerM